MIGGTDIVISTRLTTGRALSAAARVVTQRWREAVIQDGLTGDVLGSYSAVPFARVSELLIYQTEAARASWERLGAVPENDDSMIHLLAYDFGQLTLVVDDQPTVHMLSMVEGIRILVADRSLPMPRSGIQRGAA